MIEENLDIWPEATEPQFCEHSHEVKAEVVESYFTYLKVATAVSSCLLPITSEHQIHSMYCATRLP